MTAPSTTSRSATPFSLLLALLWLAWPGPLPAAEPAGYVLTSAGEVVAQQVNGVVRPLKRKSPFFPGESLRTGSDGRAQVRFRDGSLISLRPATEIRLDEFRFNEPQKGGDRNIFTLISGGFRTITGKIGKGDPNAYQMKSPVASIGIRGTTYEAVLNGGLDVAAWQGTIIIANEHGRMAVGAEGFYNFASVSAGNAAPRGLMRPPAALQDRQEIAPDEMGAEAGSATEETAPALGSEGGDEAAAGGLESAAIESGAVLLESVTAEREVVAVYTEIVSPPPPASTTDPRIAGVTLDRLAMAVAGGDGSTQMVAGGRAGLDGSGALRIADNGLDPSEPGFDTTPYIKVLSLGLAQAGAPSRRVLDTSYAVEWGGWQATVAAPAHLLTDASDLAIYSAITRPVYWISGNASTATALAARQGLVEYRNTLGFAGASDSGPIDQVYMNLSVNFDTAAAIGEMHIYAPGQYWEVKLGGRVAGPLLDFTSVSGTLNGSGAVSGNFSSLFSGGSAQAIASSFDLALTGTPSSYVAGVALVDGSGADLRLTSAEAASLDRLGFVSKINDLAGSGIKRGLASDGGVGDPLFALNQTLPGDPFFNSGINIDLLRSNGVLLPFGVYSHGLYPVSWGVWDGGALLQTSGFDPSASQQLTLTDPLFWMTVVPTLDTALAARGGGRGFYHYYSCCGGGLSVTDGAGWVETTYFDLSVDFDRATFVGSLNLYELDGDYWNLQFNGGVAGPSLASTAILPGSQYWNAASSTGYGINGELAMTLTGANGDAVATLYGLEAAGAPGFHVQGAFVAEQDQRLALSEAAGMRYIAATSGSILGSSWYLSTSAAGGQSPVFAGDTMGTPNLDYFYFATNSTVWRAGFAVESHLGSYQVMGNPAYGVNWGVWDAAMPGTEVVGQWDAANPYAEGYYNGYLHWLVFTPTPPQALAAKTGSLSYTVPVAIAAAGFDGPIAPGSFSFAATVNFDTGALSGGNLTLAHQSGPTWNMNFSAPAGSLGKAGAFPFMGATGTYDDGTVVGASGNVGLMTTGPSAEALAGSLYFWDSGGSGTKNVEGVFLICKSGGC